MENPDLSCATSSSKASPEVKLGEWRTSSRSAADLRRSDVLRKNIDDVSWSVYDRDSDSIAFGQGPAAGEKMGHPATVNGLTHNLVPLMQFVFGNKATGTPVDTWGVFESVCLESVDERGPQVVESLREGRNKLQEASGLNRRALALAYVGKLDGARVILEQVLHIREANGDYEGICGSLCNLALVCADAGGFVDAHAAVD